MVASGGEWVAIRIDRRSQPRAAPVMNNVLSELRILVVDDDADNALMLATVLELEGAATQVAHSAADGLTLIRTFRPHVLVSDIGLPDKDGYEFVRELRTMDASDGGSIPAIAVSGYSDREHAEEALRAGFQVHVPKPIDRRTLVAHLARLAGRPVPKT